MVCSQITLSLLKNDLNHSQAHILLDETHLVNQLELMEDKSPKTSPQGLHR